MKVAENVIIVGDMMRAIYTIDFKEHKPTRMLTIGASSNLSIWSTNVLPLSPTHFLVFDIEGNVFFFHRIAYPVNDIEKFVLNLIGSFKIGEQINLARFGTLAI